MGYTSFGAVPRTGKRQWRFPEFYKKPKTTQERSQYCLHKQLGIELRLKRSNSNLPNSYDDKVRSDALNKSWKTCTKRKHQWK